MNVPLYEFTGEETARPRRKWLLAVWLCPAVVAAAWGLVVLQRRGAEAQVQECFDLKTDLRLRVIAAIARVPEVPEEALQLLSLYPRMEQIDLSRTTTVAGGLRSLVLIDELRVLDLRDCAWVDDQQAEWLAELNGLERLDLSGTPITDAGLRSVSALPRLRELRFEGCQGVTDAGLEICAGMTQLSQLWPGGAGYSIDGLSAFRERRRDLNLQLQACDVVGRPRNEVEWTMGDFFGPAMHSEPAVQFVPFSMYRFDANPVAEQGVTMSLSADADIEALRKLLRFQHDWRNSTFEVRFLFDALGQVKVENYEEHIEEKWTFLQLRGPAAGRSLAKVFPLTPRLSELRLEETNIATDEFPFELVPPGLRRLTITVPASKVESLSTSLSRDEERLKRDRAGDKSSAISALFLQRLSQHAALEHLSLNDVSIDGIEPAEDIDAPADVFPVELVLPGLRTLHIENTAVSPALMRILSEHGALKELHLTDVDADGVDPSELAAEDATKVQYMDVSDISHRYGSDETGTYVQIQGPVAGRSLAKVLALTPPLIVLNLQEMTIATDQFPIERVSSKLRRLTIANSTISESFLRELSQHPALEELSLKNVVIDGHDVLAETTIRAEDLPSDRWFPRLQSLSIREMPVSESFLRILSQHPALEGLSLSDVAFQGVDDSDPALGRFQSLRWMHLTNVTVDGVAITDPAVNPLIMRLREQLPGVNLNVYTTSEDGDLQSHDLGE
jgi:Leucine-rich repeat (LRR) protein